MKTEPGRLQASTLPRTGVLSLKRFLRGLALRGTNPKSGSMRKGRVNAELETRGSHAHVRTQCNGNGSLGI